MINERDTFSYFDGVLENIILITNNNFYSKEDTNSLKNIKKQIDTWYKTFIENKSLIGIEAKVLEEIDLEITDLFSKYVEYEPINENYVERLLYDYSQLEKMWKKEMLGGKSNE